MALNATRLGTDIATKVVSTMGTPPSGPDAATFQALCVLIAQAIIDEIDNHLEAKGTVTGGGSSAGQEVTIPEGGAS